MEDSDLSSSFSDDNLEGLYGDESSEDRSDDRLLSSVNTLITACGPRNSLRELLRDIFSGLDEREDDTLLAPKLLFCTMPIALVELDADIAEEPYVVGSDGLPPTIYSSRPYFFFVASKRSQLAIVGKNTIVLSSGTSYGSNSAIHRSWISVVDVYDKYGLEMAYSYLHKIYHSQISIKNPVWLATYLVASVATLRSDFARLINQAMESQPEQLSLLCCSTLLADLTLLDTQQPRLLSEIEPHTTILPIEILARIFNSRRISKAITDELAKQRSCRPLRLGEMETRASNRTVIEIGDGVLCVAFQLKLWKLDMLSYDRVWIYCCELTPDNFPRDSALKQQLLFSYRDYARIQCTTEAEMLKQMVNEVDYEDKKMICAWILMLTVDLGLEQEREILIDDLRETFDNLIEMVEGRFVVEG